tara:strand:+ start:193 stop:777 length:585 start_codon:yes stop_codon:yes gene_type:complete
MSSLGISFSTCAVLLGLLGCVTGGGVYTDPNEVKILGDKWNNSDSDKMAEFMVNSVLKEAWLSEFQGRYKKKPVVVVDEIENNTSEHIDTGSISSSVRSRLINSRKVRFVNGKDRTRILKEIASQKVNVRASSRKKGGNQIGADYLLTGTLSSIIAQQGDYKTVTYQADFLLTNIETAEIEWNGNHKIKKSFKR